MSRWSYPTETVTVGKNSQTVRCLTAKERREFSKLGQQIRDNKIEAGQLPEIVVKWGAINPELSEEDVQTMPIDLLDACRDKIMLLTGFGEDSEEKKELPPVTSGSAPTISPAAE